MDMSSPVLGPASPGGEFLTPRTKVARMLADIDNDIDNAPPSPINRDPSSKALDEDSAEKSLSSSPDKLFGDQALPSSSNGSNQQNTSDSEDDIRPHGRAARRMLGSYTNSSDPPMEPDQNEVDELYSLTPMKDKALAKSISPSPIRSESGGGLFVSPTKSVPENSDDEDLPANPIGDKEKLAALVAKKREERLAREAEEKERAEQTASSDLPEGAYEEAEDTPVDRNIEKIMSDASRPAWKASKKALEEMERETQRMARQQALAHQMKVKKKFTTSDLFARFNFRQQAVPEAPKEQLTEGDTTASSVPNSDGVEENPKDPHVTPPSSPPSPLDVQKALVEKGALSKLVPVRQDSIQSLTAMDDDDGEEDLPDMIEIMRRAKEKPVEPTPVSEPLPEKKGLKLARFGKQAASTSKDDSDDELDIIRDTPANLPAHLRAFQKAAASDRVTRPADSRAMHNLKHLSHFNHDAQPTKKGSRPSVAPKALEAQLRKRAKEQARLQQIERIEELRAKGIEVQTAEEREKEAEAFENLLEKARQDAVELRKAEKAARKEAGEDVVEASEDEDEDDGDFVGSGSEEEEGEEGDDEKEENELFDEAADETDEEEEADDEGEMEEDDGSDVDEPAEQKQAAQEASASADPEDDVGPIRKSRVSRVVKDDDDESDEETNEAPENDASAEDDPFAAFGFGAMNGNALMSPTQAFNATMQTPTQATQEDSFDILKRIAPPPSTTSLPPIPDFDTQEDSQGVSQLSFVAGSQVPESQRINLNWETQPPETPVPAGLNRGPSALGETPGWEPSQDGGLPSPGSVARKFRRESTLNSLADHETQSTVELRVSESPAPSQPAPKRGKLGHRRVPLLDDSDDEVAAPPASLKPDKKDAFREMARRRKDALTTEEKDAADKEMRLMMDEAAEESEDEYAGLGGDDYVAPETEQDREMIDSSEINVDERALAAHFAERQRQRDEAETSKLYKDLTTGVLRRKMGANAFDLDEDEDEVAARRRQMRQQEEAKKRRALLKDENIATLAEGKNSKGKDAFLKAIADDDDRDDDMGGVSDHEDETVPDTQEESTQSQPQSQPAGTQPLREISGNKRKLSDDDLQDERAPANKRRTQSSAFKRPTSMLEVQESVSFLLDEPNAGVSYGPTVLGLSSDSENEDESQKPNVADEDDEEVAAEEARQNNGGFAPNPDNFESQIMPPPRLPASQRRTAPKGHVVDRLSLKRGSSTSSVSSNGSALGRTAWAAGPTTGGFKVPSLLRRATTSSLSSGSDSGVSKSKIATGVSASGGVKMGGSKKSSLAYQARAEERRAIVEASAKRRQENTAKIAQMRRTSSQLGKGLGGRFE